MAQGKVTQPFPYVINEEPGIKFWCSCGLSKTQPYCDGKHKGTDFVPEKVVIDEKKRVPYCGCRLSKKGHFCDNAHKDLAKK